ncbi:DUF3243 domain-containing protein [Metabacillus sp. RGM 3146]|uniref:DUF3243 domain-containing protein n=1 Tax=Metabacillus sp. RGM 3146 TaxID=3401092 RepID=UPI003B9B1157
MSEEKHMVNRQGKVNPLEVDDVLNRIDHEKADEILSSFEHFKKYLAGKIEVGKKLGLGNEQLAMTAEKIAGYLAENIEPKNREEYVLKELWKAGDQEQQHHLAHMLINMVTSE